MPIKDRRAQAARDILSYSDGRPSQARQVTVADLEAMSPAHRQELLETLLIRYETEMPGTFKAMMVEAYHEAAKCLLTHQVAPKIKFRRGDDAQIEASLSPPPPRCARAHAGAAASDAAMHRSASPARERALPSISSKVELAPPRSFSHAPTKSHHPNRIGDGGLEPDSAGNYASLYNRHGNGASDGSD